MSLIPKRASFRASLGWLADIHHEAVNLPGLIGGQNVYIECEHTFSGAPWMSVFLCPAFPASPRVLSLRLPISMQPTPRESSGST